MVACPFRLLCAALLAVLASNIYVAGVPLTVRAQPVTQPFTFSLVPHSMQLVTDGTIAMGDMDNDGDLDVYLSGVQDERIVTALFRNEGTDTADGSTFVFAEDDVAFPPLLFGAAAWGDYDGDGDLDLAVTGSRSATRPYDPVTLLYRNDEGQLFATDAALAGFHSGPVLWGDYDNDGDLDLLVGGQNEDGQSGSILYRNDDGVFTDAFAERERPLPGLAYGAASFGDSDSDGDLDLVLSGISENGTFADVFRNDDGAYIPVNAGIEPALFGSFDWGDFDQDGDLDLIQSGGGLTPRILGGLTRVYENAGMDFDSLAIRLPDALSGAATWGDYDDDGDLDILVMGAREALGPRTAEVFANEEGELVRRTYLVGLIFGSASWGDIDGDGDLDLLTTGHPTQFVPLVNLYENRRQVLPPPDPPSGLSSDVNASEVRLRWMESPAAAATYNLRIGTNPGRGDVLSPMSDPLTGQRLIAARGNTDRALAWRLQGLAPGTYYWSVQSLDQAFRGSRFAPEQTFTIAEATSSEDPPPEPALQTMLHPPSPNPSAGPIRLRYDVEHRAHVVIRIHDILGREVATLFDGEREPGSYQISWNVRTASGSLASSGLYLCDFQAGSHRQVRSVLLSR